MMNATLNAEPTVVLNGQGKILRAFGDEVLIKHDTNSTNGAFTLWVNTTPPGGGPPPHYHLNEDELFMVQDGQMSFLINGHWRDVGPGGIVFAPRGSVHTFHNNSDRSVRMTILTQPAGFEVFFARCAEEFNRPGGPDMNRIVAISAEHGIHYFTPDSNQ